MRNFFFLTFLMASPFAFAEEAPLVTEACHKAILGAAADFAPRLSGGRCYGFIEEEGSLKPYGAVPGVFSIRVRTQNGSCSHEIWVKVDSNCRPRGAGQAE